MTRAWSRHSRLSVMRAARRLRGAGTCGIWARNPIAIPGGTSASTIVIPVERGKMAQYRQQLGSVGYPDKVGDLFWESGSEPAQPDPILRSRKGSSTRGSEPPPVRFELHWPSTGSSPPLPFHSRRGPDASSADAQPADPGKHRKDLTLLFTEAGVAWRTEQGEEDNPCNLCRSGL